jgi:hypothetical protein
VSTHSPSEITFESLKHFLLKVGFEQTSSRKNALALHHRESDTIVALLIPADGKTVRPADLTSVVFRLEYQGLVGESALHSLRAGKLPVAS